MSTANTTLTAIITRDWLDLPDADIAIEAIRQGAYGSCGLDTWAAEHGLDVNEAADMVLAVADAD